MEHSNRVVGHFSNPDQRCVKGFLWSVLHSIVASCIVYHLNTIQPSSYMDEYFHEKQTLDYVAGNWSYWDPKITTPPGLYILTSLLFRLLPFAHPSVCHFRYLNCILLGFNYFLVNSLINRDSIVLLTSTVVMLPNLFFCSILFYTDQLSLSLVLLTIWSHSHGKKCISFLAASGACCVRQTNIVWCAFVVGLTIAKRVSSSKRFEKKQPLKWVLYVIKSPCTILEAVVNTCMYDCPLLVLVGVGFLVFVFLNDGIVLGDRSAHEVSLNIPQMFYFFVFTALQTPLRFCRFFKRSITTLMHSGWKAYAAILLFTALLIAIGLASVYCCTVEHKYILADNRHYTTFIWRNLFRRFTWFRYAIVPVYILAGAYVLSAFIPFDGRPCLLEELLKALVFSVLTAVCLITTPLLEFRYFIIPFVLWKLQIHKSTHTDISSLLVVSEWTLNFVVNAVTIWVFLYRPFKWVSEPSIDQRFMW